MIEILKSVGRGFLIIMAILIPMAIVYGGIFYFFGPTATAYSLFGTLILLTLYGIGEALRV